VSPEKVIDPAEQERLRRMDIQTRIQHELQKIRELEERRREQSEKERKRQELKRQIQSELDKIRGLDPGAKKSEADGDMPLWMKMVADPEARKAYMESKRARPSQSVGVSQAAPSKSSTADDATPPKWVQVPIL
jgi:membrane protein involved in colicin uptake